MTYFVYFILYSFIGFFLETAYSLITKGMFVWKKCFLFNLLCPVYGIGAVSILYTTKNVKNNKYLTFFIGGITATAIEFFIHILYKELFGVSVWDYSDTSFNIQGRICLKFTLFWCVLAIILVYHIHPFVEKMSKKIPTKTIIFFMIFVSIDSIISIYLLKSFGNTNAININWLIVNYQTLG